MALNAYFKRGLKDSVPIMISFFFVFSALGALYHERGYHFFDTALGTIAIFAGPLQISLVDILARGQVFTALALTVLINFRFLFMAMVASQYFKGVSKVKVFLSLQMFSASTYAVSHAHFQSEEVNDGESQFRYFLGVAAPSYGVAVLATIIGYLGVSYFNYSSVALFAAMVLPIHFTALTAKNSKKGFTVLATVLGGIGAPILVNHSEWLMVLVPVACGIALAALETKRQSKEAV